MLQADRRVGSAACITIVHTRLMKPSNNLHLDVSEAESEIGTEMAVIQSTLSHDYREDS